MFEKKVWGGREGWGKRRKGGGERGLLRLANAYVYTRIHKM